MASQLSPSRGVPAASEPEGQNSGDRLENTGLTGRRGGGETFHDGNAAASLPEQGLRLPPGGRVQAPV